ncbi:hypothetical protein RND71_000381 [Anisodus tanguticus]|uniref:Aminoacyl-transfer RNA synthetases class-II family profile domain-containing protein n=1 Tax=Anisodus tanguticus TaxID=243964 RepID=A0AAE1VXJ0_9SOLA|nr:hypothetical protein RND71_000381 [Anisodus tanguticus]
MSLLFRCLPTIALRSKPSPLPLTCLPFFYLNFHNPTSLINIRPLSSTSVTSPLSNTKISPSPATDELQWVSRNQYCGELSENDVGKRVRLCGWVALHRIHGGLTFVNLRDQSGMVQITTLPDDFPEAHSTVSDLRLEYVVAIKGVVRPRPAESVNKKMKTGMIEVAAEDVQVLNAVRLKLPFLVTTADDAKDSAKEEIRLRSLMLEPFMQEFNLVHIFRYRCLDLRRPQMSSNIILRHRVVKLLRRYLEDAHDFVEIETPILSRSTPEGARDYLVPSRVQPGTFYALPQSPQLFKQMLMVSGFDKYYQIARCFRDEDLRADRQPEFTQLDMEMAFTSMEDMLKLNEDMIRKVFQEIQGVQLPNPFPRLTYAEAMSRYGSDRPDTRFDVELRDVSGIFSNTTFKIFSDTLASGGIIKALCVPSGTKTYSNTALKKGDIYKEAIKSGAKGLPFLKVLNDGSIEGIPPLVSSLDTTKKEELLNQFSAVPDDLILFAVGHHAEVNKTLDRLRTYVAHALGLIDNSRHSILWVTDFPMFEWNDSEQRLEALHHPFTAPNPEDINDLSSARALAYDMVYNGVEIGGGSLRIYKRDVQEKVLNIVGISREQLANVRVTDDLEVGTNFASEVIEINMDMLSHLWQAEAKFGYLLEALDMGAPPHGVSSEFRLIVSILMLFGPEKSCIVRDLIPSGML